MALSPVEPRDLPAIASFLGWTRAHGGLSHPGGTQWWLRELGHRADFEALVERDGQDLTSFLLIDDSFSIIETRPGGRADVDLCLWIAEHQRQLGRPPARFHVLYDGPSTADLMARGFAAAGGELELIIDVADEPQPAPLPPGFRLTDLTEVGDDAYIELHRAAWSDKRPSTYDPARHAAVKAMPQFDPALVTIAVAPDGQPAACCILWHDAQSATAEIEPLGTHHNFRRLGLATAIVREAFRRAWQSGSRQVLVWNDPSTNPAAYGLYTGAGMSARRRLTELRAPA